MKEDEEDAQGLTHRGLSRPPLSTEKKDSFSRSVKKTKWRLSLDGDNNGQWSTKTSSSTLRTKLDCGDKLFSEILQEEQTTSPIYTGEEEQETDGFV